MLAFGTQQSKGIVAGVVAVVLVAAFGFAVVRGAAFTRGDLAIDQALSRAHNPVLVALATGAHWIFDPAQAIVLTLLIVIAIIAVTRNIRLGVTFGAVVAISWVPSDIVKILVHRPRPDAAQLLHPFVPAQTDPSYPSGHTVFVASLAIALILLARGKSYQPVVAVVAIVVALVVTSAFPYLGVHYVSDVVASLVWSAGMVPLALSLWNRIVLPRTHRRR